MEKWSKKWFRHRIHQAQKEIKSWPVWMQDRRKYVVSFPDKRSER